MIINIEREPYLSLYYLGSVFMTILREARVMPIEELFVEIQNNFEQKIHVDFLYYALDWLFLLSLVKVEEGSVYYEDSKVDCT